jgi:hypothetical protein
MSVSPQPPQPPTREVAGPGTTTYSVVPGTATTDRDLVARLWQVSGLGNLSDGQQKARYDWFYLANPQGTGDISFLHPPAGDAPVGFLGVGRREWFLAGEPMYSGVLVDFVVHPEHRTAAPALMLQRRGRERAQQWARLLTGLPDVKAVAIFKRLGADFQCSLPRYVRIVRYGGYIRRKLPAVIASVLGVLVDAADSASRALRLVGTKLKGGWTDRLDERFDRFWERFDKREFSIGLRNARFLAWRFGQQPEHRYRTFAVTDTQGELTAYFVCELEGEALQVKDLLVAGSEKDCVHALLLLAGAGRKLGAAAISLQVFGDPVLDRALRAAQFVERDKRPFFAVLNESIRERASGLRWYITQADEDI